MIVRARIPSSKRGRKLARAVPKTSLTRPLTAMWGRAAQPGLASLSANYRPRS